MGLYIYLGVVAMVLAFLAGSGLGFRRGWQNQIRRAKQEAEATQRRAFEQLRVFQKQGATYVRITFQVLAVGLWKGERKHSIVNVSQRGEIERLQRLVEAGRIRIEQPLPQVYGQQFLQHISAAYLHLSDCIAGATTTPVSRLVREFHPQGVTQGQLRELLSSKMREAASEGMQHTVMSTATPLSPSNGGVVRQEPKPERVGFIAAIKNTLLPGRGFTLAEEPVSSPEPEQPPEVHPDGLDALGIGSMDDLADDGKGGKH